MMVNTNTWSNNDVVSTCAARPEVVYPSPQWQRPEKTNFAHPPPRVTGIN